MEPFHRMQSTFFAIGQPKFWVKKEAHPFGYSFSICLTRRQRVSKVVAVVPTILALISSFCWQSREAV